MQKLQDRAISDSLHQALDPQMPYLSHLYKSLFLYHGFPQDEEMVLNMLLQELQTILLTSVDKALGLKERLFQANHRHTMMARYGYTDALSIKVEELDQNNIAGTIPTPGWLTRTLGRNYKCLTTMRTIQSTL